MAIPDKTYIRKEFLAKRNALEPAERARNSSLIRQRVFGHLAWRNATTILCYVSFGSEVETHTLIQEALRFKKRIVVPLHDPDKTKTPLSELRRFVDLGPSHRGVLQLQPEFNRPVEPSSIELALLPGIAFDRQGGRIGFGGGFFDRLLPSLTKAFCVGLAFECQVVHDPLPLESFDMRMHTIVTEKAVIEARRMTR
jgi:5-formyltetrahydrofolate cyclo-ligase